MRLRELEEHFAQYDRFITILFAYITVLSMK
jgi:hypothetical protein